MGLKHLMRPAVDRAAQLTGVLRRWERRMMRGVTVLMYHRVLPDAQCAEAPLPGLVMPTSAFAAQVRWLSEHCRVVTVAEAVRELRDRPESFSHANGHARPTVALSFDDGYRDNHQHAFAILREHGMVATFFVTTAMIDGDRPLWFDIAARAWRRWGAQRAAQVAGEAIGERIAPPTTLEAWMESLKHRSPAQREAIVQAIERSEPALARPETEAMMDIAALRELCEHGHEIGAHSQSHELLPQLDDAALEDEVAGARRALEAKLDAGVVGYCYPNGDHDDRVVEAVKRAGYGYACTTRPGLNEPGADAMRLRRIDVTAQRVLDHAGRADLRGFRSELCGLREALR